MLVILQQGRPIEMPGALANITHALVVAGTILLIAGGGLFGEGYAAGIWLVSTLVPWIAATGTVVAYLAWIGPGYAIDDHVFPG